MPIDKQTLSRFVSRTFIETGTYVGDGVRVALSCGFERIVSIEIDPTLFKSADAKFTGTNNVRVLLGSSSSILPSLIVPNEERCTFWLDAHYCGPPAGGLDFNDYLFFFVEVGCIAGYRRNDHIILIDDMRLVPEIERQKLERMLKAINPLYTVDYVDGFEANDIMVARLI